MHVPGVTGVTLNDWPDGPLVGEIVAVPALGALVRHVDVGPMVTGPVGVVTMNDWAKAAPVFPKFNVDGTIANGMGVGVGDGVAVGVGEAVGVGDDVAVAVGVAVGVVVGVAVAAGVGLGVGRVVNAPPPPPLHPASATKKAAREHAKQRVRKGERRTRTPIPDDLHRRRDDERCTRSFGRTRPPGQTWRGRSVR